MEGHVLTQDLNVIANVGSGESKVKQSTNKLAIMGRIRQKSARGLSYFVVLGHGNFKRFRSRITSFSQNI